MYLMYGRCNGNALRTAGSMPVDIRPAVLLMSTKSVGWTTDYEIREASDQQPIFTILEYREKWPDDSTGGCNTAPGGRDARG
ncbi:uncharacterized protein TNCT_260121 [Trichonephila clavata]|uniref:Uncharacterized protein n=1 Tax=Trichonephila clavata TaxID=2740835 RepID=A0A8X6M4D3_TRICU|nr:uncharacterized protein TNCT_260121 [Trichonephila clavata]